MANGANERSSLCEAQRRVDETRKQRARLRRGLAHAAALGLDVGAFKRSIQSIEDALGALTAQRDLLEAAERGIPRDAPARLMGR